MEETMELLRMKIISGLLAVSWLGAQGNKPPESPEPSKPAEAEIANTQVKADALDRVPKI
jgi:hypothetical protein